MTNIELLLELTLTLDRLIMAYVQFRFFSGYLEEPSRTRPVIGHLSSSSMGKRNTDITLHLPLQEPPTDQMNDRLRL